MHILCVGLNHHTAGINLRERLSFSEDSVRSALARIGCGSDAFPGCIKEMVILSTCNRVEIYAVSTVEDYSTLEDYIEEVKAVPRATFSRYLYCLSGLEAVNHLLRVSAGLDSMVIGEHQILGQVAGALEVARSQRSAGPILTRLFQTAIRAGKRARTETAIGQNPASISSMAVRLAEMVIPDLKMASILVVGAGEMAELAVESLRKRGSNTIKVINRTQARARLLAERWGGEAAAYEQLSEALKAADVVITSTGAPHTIIREKMVSEVMASRAARPLVIMDIAVPRDVEPDVAHIRGVMLYDLDSIQENLEDSLNGRAREIPQVERILDEMQEEFDAYLALLDVFPIIAQLHQRAEEIRQVELEKTLRRLPNLSDREREHLSALTQSLVKKILHPPISRLRNAAGSPEALEFAEAARELFDLEAGQVASDRAESGKRGGLPG